MEFSHAGFCRKRQSGILFKKVTAIGPILLSPIPTIGFLLACFLVSQTYYQAWPIVVLNRFLR